ncbi:MAG: CvpA family protein [Bacteroidales bacterium]|nr:CvpA family protein [Candidatus Latescibacterota bacterium]
MDILKIITIVVLVLFFFFGLKRGLLRQVLEVLGVIGAFIGSFYMAHHFAAYLEGRFDLSYRIALVIAAAAIFIVIIILFHFIGLALQKLFKKTVLGWFDRIMGGVFGALKGALLVSLILVIIISLPLDRQFRKDIIDDPFLGIIYPVLPVMFDLVLSRTGTDFSKITRVEELAGIDKMKKSVDEIGDRLEEEKERLDSVVGGD